MPGLAPVTVQVLEHLGPLHPVEQVLLLTLAFGPFAVLALVVWWGRRRDRDNGGENRSAGRGWRS